MSQTEIHIRRKLHAFVSGSLTLDEFKYWFMPVSHEVRTTNQGPIDLISSIESKIGNGCERTARESLRGILG